MRLLLDAHISLAVASALQSLNIEAMALRSWHQGAYLDSDDAKILDMAHCEALTLVSYDLRTIPILLKDWAEQGTPHGGLILVDTHTLLPSDIGGLTRALQRLCAELGDLNWENRVIFLSR